MGFLSCQRSRNINNSPCLQLESTVSWNPDHSLIAAVQTERRGLQVSFFERNGLRHGEFLLPVAALRNPCVGYNSVGDVLAVSGSTESTHELQLWTRGNYHWYLKVRRQFPQPVRCLFWNPVEDRELTAVLEVGKSGALNGRTAIWCSCRCCGT